MRMRRRPRLPDDVRALLDLPHGDRLLTAAELTEGWAAVSVRALHVVTAAGAMHRPWSDVDGAALDPESAELTVTWVDGSPPLVLALADLRAAALPRAVHERVQSSVVHSEKVTLAGGGLVRVALRRGADGTLFTQVIGTGRVDLRDPGTARAVAAAEGRVREAAGLG